MSCTRKTLHKSSDFLSANIQYFEKGICGKALHLCKSFVDITYQEHWAKDLGCLFQIIIDTSGEQVIHQHKNIKYQDVNLGIVLKVKKKQFKMDSEKGQVRE